MDGDDEERGISRQEGKNGWRNVPLRGGTHNWHKVEEEGVASAFNNLEVVVTAVCHSLIMRWAHRDFIHYSPPHSMS